MHDVPLFPGQAGYTREQLEHEMSRIGTADRAQRIGQVAMAESGPRCLLRHRWRPGPEPVRRAGASAERAGLTSFAGVPARHRIVARRQLRALGLSVIDATAQASRARQEIARVIVEPPPPQLKDARQYPRSESREPKGPVMFTAVLARGSGPPS